MARADRRPGSVRFATYWKCQWRDEISMAWRDVQQSFDDPDGAADAARFRKGFFPKEGVVWRLMEISEEGRRPLAPMTTEGAARDA